MKITIAIDSFKGSLSSMEAGTAAMEGVKAALPNAEVYVRPLADGGEGTVEALAAGMGGRIRRVTRSGGILPDERVGLFTASAPVAPLCLRAAARGQPCLPHQPAA